MTHGGYGGGQPDPFGPDPFGGPPGTQGYSPPPVTQGFSAGQGFPPPLGTPHGEVNTLATLSIVFAFVFAPAGAALGHVALYQIKRRGQRGRERAIVGLTLSYVIIVLAVIALLIWLVTANSSQSPSGPASTTATQTTTGPLRATSADDGDHAAPGAAPDGQSGAASGRRLCGGSADPA